MTEIIITNLPEPDKLGLGIRWRKHDGLLYVSHIVVDTNAGGEKIVSSLRELADKIEKQLAS